MFPAGRKVIVEGLTFRAESGQVLGLLGANASGKSTILKALADPHNRFSGEVSCGGQPLLPGQIAYVPQAAAETLSPWLDVRREIALPLRVAGVPQRQWWPEIEQLTTKLGMAVPLGRRVERLSGGQRVKVALLRALAVREKRLLILDEPFEGLDAESRAAVIRIVRDEAAKGIPVIVTSHRAEDLQAMGARMVVMSRGAPITALQDLPSPYYADAEKPERQDAMDDLLSTIHESASEDKGRRRAAMILFGMLGSVGGLIAWAGLALMVGNPGLLPSPSAVARAMVRLVSSSELAPHFAATMTRAAFGWIGANLLAVPLGVLLGYDVRFFQTVAPWLSVGRAIPIFVLVAPAAGLFPRAPEAQRFFLIWLTLFVIAVQAVSAAAALAPRRRVRIARAFGASHWFRLTRIMPYEAVGGIFSALEVTLPLSVVVCLVLETFLIPKTGLGLYLFNHLNDSDLSLLFAHILWPGVVVAICLALVRALSRSFRYDS
jgi:ABC-type multidrug transport system ATPase subunit/ABC-type nitrate/sulfonate/bicarbonate transport system permease component